MVTFYNKTIHLGKSYYLLDPDKFQSIIVDT